MVEIRTISAELSSMRGDKYQDKRRRQRILGDPGEMGVWRESDDASGPDARAHRSSSTASISQTSHLVFVVLEHAIDLKLRML